MKNKHPHFFNLFSKFNNELVESTLAPEEKVDACEKFIESLQPITPSNAQYISETYKLSGNILFENKNYKEALEHYKKQFTSISHSHRAPVESSFVLRDAYYGIGKTLFELDDIDEAKKNFISASEANDKIVSSRYDKNECTSTYFNRTQIFSHLLEIANKQKDNSALLGLSSNYYEKLKFPGVCLPIADGIRFKIRPLQPHSLTSIEFKCSLAINHVCNFLSLHYLSVNDNDKALEVLDFTLEKINEFELFNRRYKDKTSRDTTAYLSLDPEKVASLCIMGGNLCLKNGQTEKFKEYALKGLEYYDPKSKNEYLNFVFNNMEQINSVSQLDYEKDLENISKIHRRVCDSFSDAKHYDETLKLFTSFDFPEPSIEDPKLYKIFVDKKHHISEINKKQFGKNQSYDDLIKEEYRHLIKFGNLILSGYYDDYEAFSTKDRIEIVNRILDKANDLGSDFDEDKIKFEEFARLNKIVEQKNNYTISYEISGFSYVEKKRNSSAPEVEIEEEFEDGVFEEERFEEERFQYQEFRAGGFENEEFGAGGFGAGAFEDERFRATRARAEGSREGRFEDAGFKPEVFRVEEFEDSELGCEKFGIEGLGAEGLEDIEFKDSELGVEEFGVGKFGIEKFEVAEYGDGGFGAGAFQQKPSSHLSPLEILANLALAVQPESDIPSFQPRVESASVAERKTKRSRED